MVVYTPMCHVAAVFWHSCSSNQKKKKTFYLSENNNTQTFMCGRHLRLILYLPKVELNQNIYFKMAQIVYIFHRKREKYKNNQKNILKDTKVKQHRHHLLILVVFDWPSHFIFVHCKVDLTLTKKNLNWHTAE